VRLFHNIFYRRFKSIPLSYYKRGRELIVAETFTSSVSASLKLNEVGILSDYFNDKSNFQFGTSNISEFYLPEITQTGLVLKNISYELTPYSNVGESFGLKNISHELTPYSNADELFGLKNNNYELTSKEVVENSLSSNEFNYNNLNLDTTSNSLSSKIINNEFTKIDTA